MEIENKDLEKPELKEIEPDKNIDFINGDLESVENNDLMNKVKNFLDFSFETIRVVIISLIIIFIVRSFIIQPFFVKGSSMIPNFHDGDYLIVNELSYEIGKPQRGDVMIFRYPNNPSEFFIKRVIGLPGETIQIQNDKITIYNTEKPEGFVLDESHYLASSVITAGEIFQKLGPNEYYVLGDNRVASSDSRTWGVLNSRFIIGKAWVRAWPFADFKIFEPFSYNK
jgi:signal peptidase I